jgi:rhomboid family GlyGly-CTERM serine protease
MRIELGVLAAIIFLLNLPLLRGACAVNFILLPDAVAAGEWWRLFTHAFVHVSWYHLVLDATAFLVLYAGLDRTTSLERIGYLLACDAGSVLASLWGAPLIHTHGLCGLSGVAHGLMAVSTLDMMRSTSDPMVRRAGILAFILVVSKCAIEAASGHVVLENFHFGPLGWPVSVCHAGGVLGGLAFSLRPSGYSQARYWRLATSS